MGAVELGAAGRQDIAGDAVLLAGVLEVFVELGAAVDLAGADGERGGLDELAAEVEAAMPARRRVAPALQGRIDFSRISHQAWLGGQEAVCGTNLRGS